MADLVQLECLRGLTRAVRVVSDQGEGELFFDQGQLVHAETGELVGERAALRILSWEGGKVEPISKYWLEGPTIQTGWQALLMVAAQRRDEQLRSAPEPKENQAMPSNATANGRGKGPASGIRRRVAIAADGQVIRTYGELGELPDAVSYAMTLANLMREDLGLDELRGFESTGPDIQLIAYLQPDGVTEALEADVGTDLSPFRKKAGM